MIAGLMICLVCVACAGQQVKPITEWSPKQKAAFFMQVYNVQYDLYLTQAAYPELTAAEKEILRAKKEALTAIYPMIQAYDLVVAAGGTPSPSDEAAIMGLLDSLQRSVLSKKKSGVEAAPKSGGVETAATMRSGTVPTPQGGPAPLPCACDLVKDGACDMNDYQLFIQDWGRKDCGTPAGSGGLPNDCECDLNRDGKCNILDYQLFVQGWGRTDCP
jgi:hypothetical protein